MARMLLSSRAGRWMVSGVFLIGVGLPARAQEQAVTPPDPALVAKSDVAQKLVDDTFVKKAAADKIVKDAQGKVKVAIEGVVKAKADEAKLTGELVPLEKALVEKTAAVTKANEDAKPLEKAYQDAVAAAKAATDNKVAADKLVVDSAVISKATGDVAAAAKIAAEKAPTEKGIADLKVLADKVAGDIAIPVSLLGTTPGGVIAGVVAGKVANAVANAADWVESLRGD